MHSALDSLFEIELDRCVYDGHSLVAEVNELVVDSGRRIVQGKRRLNVLFPRPIAHAITEEFPASYAQLLEGNDIGFLRCIDASSLRIALGLDLEQFQSNHAYALVTAHEVLVAYCREEPIIQEYGG
jgi:hypothetical protein